jgi:hypothetical protein
MEGVQSRMEALEEQLRVVREEYALLDQVNREHKQQSRLLSSQHQRQLERQQQSIADDHRRVQARNKRWLEELDQLYTGMVEGDQPQDPTSCPVDHSSTCWTNIDTTYNALELRKLKKETYDRIMEQLEINRRLKLPPKPIEHLESMVVVDEEAEDLDHRLAPVRESREQKMESSLANSVEWSRHSTTRSQFPIPERRGKPRKDIDLSAAYDQHMQVRRQLHNNKQQFNRESYPSFYSEKLVVRREEGDDDIHGNDKLERCPSYRSLEF